MSAKREMMTNEELDHQAAGWDRDGALRDVIAQSREANRLARELAAHDRLLQRQHLRIAPLVALWQEETKQGSRNRHSRMPFGSPAKF